jgi:3'-phosphoadenosine 5'-phosphosulfate sulfotransferase (PAPS reductase)/FAD synthetase
VSDPFRIDGPTCISFSGGRTSGYMLWRVLQSNGGLPENAIVCFANTGKEDEETLRFVRDCSMYWSVPITWLEYRDDEHGFEVVDFRSASRDGEPFEALIRKRNYLPNPVTRFCTSELKIRAMYKLLKAKGWLDDGLDMMVGIRADEQRRVAKMRSGKHSESSNITNIVPLADAGVTVQEVGSFWDRQPFNLELATYSGRTLAGNCDLCFLKPAAQIQSLIQERPDRAVWWARMEGAIQSSGKFTGNGARFRQDRPSYAEMGAFASSQRDMFDPDEEAIACFCGD